MGAALPERPERHHDLVARDPPVQLLEDFGEAFTPELQEQEAKLAEQLRSQQQAWWTRGARSRRSGGSSARASSPHHPRLLRDVGLAESRGTPSSRRSSSGRAMASPAARARLMAAARGRAIDRIRRERGRDERYAAGGARGRTPTRPRRSATTCSPLVFVTCHPVLPRESRVALTLRLLGGLSTEEVARAFLVLSPTIERLDLAGEADIGGGARAVRGPAGGRAARRLAAVLEIVYLVFNEGYSASSGEAWIRRDLAREAMRLGRVLAGLLRAPRCTGWWR